ncbi:hypothetical protein [Hyphomicrobium denitrificans]|uniref:hypothetical protein n=1 Tax=Hyphomicrobium denitrificans TaxID=53399 RepID=UPI001FDA0391|nr:hypothetical protein [Hyphomicrobium denitrificans]
MMPTIKQQIAAIIAAWPTLRLERSDDRRALWRGPLRPSFSSYEVSIAYMAPSIVELIDPLRQQPRVRVVDPVLRQRRGMPKAIFRMLTGMILYFHRYASSITRPVNGHPSPSLGNHREMDD